jgi:hypothetical protein
MTQPNAINPVRRLVGSSTTVKNKTHFKLDGYHVFVVGVLGPAAHSAFSWYSSPMVLALVSHDDTRGLKNLRYRLGNTKWNGDVHYLSDGGRDLRESDIRRVPVLYGLNSAQLGRAFTLGMQDPHRSIADTVAQVMREVPVFDPQNETDDPNTRISPRRLVDHTLAPDYRGLNWLGAPATQANHNAYTLPRISSAQLRPMNNPSRAAHDSHVGLAVDLDLDFGSTPVRQTSTDLYDDNELSSEFSEESHSVVNANPDPADHRDPIAKMIATEVKNQVDALGARMEIRLAMYQANLTLAAEQLGKEARRIRKRLDEKHWAGAEKTKAVDEIQKELGDLCSGIANVQRQVGMLGKLVCWASRTSPTPQNSTT